MKHLKILVFALVAMLASCGSEEGGGGNAPTEKTTVDGIVEKGPFVQGSKVTLYDLDGDMTQTGLQFVTTTSNDLGNFTFTLLRRLRSVMARSVICERESELSHSL